MKVCVIYENIAFCQIVDRFIVQSKVIKSIAISEIKIKANAILAELNHLEWDYIVIGANEGLSDLIIELLVKCGSLERGRLIDFYRNYHSMLKIPKIQKLMSNPKYYDIKGLIMGLSHLETGMVSEMFPKKTCNIAVGGQDLYYNFKSLEWCIKNHRNHLTDLEFVIIDMYDYSYFNVDTSLGKNAINYYSVWDGYIWDGHNFDNNKNFKISFVQLKEILDADRNRGLTEYEEEIFSKLFPDIMLITNYEEYEDDYKVKNIFKIVTQEELDNYIVESSVMLKEFLTSWNENIESFEKILNLLREINHDMKIKLVLTPRCFCVEERMKIYESKLKSKYYSVLEKMQKKYQFEIFDLKDLCEISMNREYYYDPEHLNRNGAERFTQYFLENCME